MKLKNMTRGKIIIWSIVNGILGWLIVAAIASLKHPDITFVQELGNWYSISMGVAALVGSFIGFTRKYGE